MEAKPKKQLFFDYPSTSRIRFKIGNCYESPDYPLIYRICTAKLIFDVPKKMALLGKDHVFIPLSYYQQVLTNYYLGRKLISN